jgi:hypothetical protein
LQQVEKLNSWKEENEINKKVKVANEEKIKKEEIKLAKYVVAARLLHISDEICFSTHSGLLLRQWKSKNAQE